MEKKFKAVPHIVKFLIIIAPFIIGGIGFSMVYHGEYINGFYDALCLYGLQLNIDKEQVNLLVEIARWGAPCMTVAVLFTVLSVLFKNMHVRIIAHKPDAVAIHGDSRYIPVLAEKLGKRATVSESAYSFKAANQLLVFDSDYELVRYIHQHENEMIANPENTMYLCTERLVRGSYRDQNLQICNFAENCARKFWTDNLLQPEEKNILIIGFGNYGQEILNQGLLINVRGISSDLQYHVFGNSKEYRSLHYKMDKIVSVGNNASCIVSGRDAVIYHDTNWYEETELIHKADRIILAYDEEDVNLMLLNELNKYYFMKRVFIKVFNEKVISSLWDIKAMQITTFGTDEDMCTPEMILEESTMIPAKMCHATYSRSVPESYGGCPEREASNCSKTLSECIRCKWLLDSWNANNYFTKYSNVAQADHMPVKEQLLLDGADYPEGVAHGDYLKQIYESYSEEKKMEMREIEHIRWMRYHFMHNWDYAPEKNKATHLHNLLVPFQELSLAEQLKDDDTYYTLFDIYNTK